MSCFKWLEHVEKDEDEDDAKEEGSKAKSSEETAAEGADTNEE